MSRRTIYLTFLAGIILVNTEMKVIAGCLLAVLCAKTNLTIGDIKTILTAAVGAEADEDRLQLLLKEVQSEVVTELIASAYRGSGATPAAAEAREEEEWMKIFTRA